MVQCTTVSIMLILEILLKLKSKQGDVTAAFLHADVGKDEDIYVEMPLDFRKKGKVLKLKKTLYGLRYVVTQGILEVLDQGNEVRARWKHLPLTLACSLANE